MNKQFRSLALLASLVAIPFTGCVKDPVTPTADERRPSGWWIGIGKRFNNCADAKFICIVPDDRPFPDMLKVPAEVDQVAALPTAQPDGSIACTATVNANNLSQRAKSLLLERRVLELDEDVELSSELIRMAYENAGLSYNGQRVAIPKGTYKTEVSESPAQRTIKITIKVKSVTITIIIEY